MKKILITYTNTGAGHRIPALAIAQRIEELHPGQFNIVTSNFFEDAGEIKFNNFIEKSWDFLLTKPYLTTFIIILGKVLYRLTPDYIRLCHRKVWLNSMEYIKKVDPCIIVTTHFFTQSIAVDAKKKYDLKYPIIAFNPDTFETFPQWSRGGDLFLVCSPLAKRSALKLGHSEEKIKIVSQALRKEFNEVHTVDQKELRKEYGLREDVFMILMTDGGQGVGRMKQSINQLLKSDLSLNIIAICGKNKELYKELSAKQKELKEQNKSIQIFAYGFVDSITPFIQMSDLFVGKSGPATVMECLKMKLPVLVNFSANTAERKTAQYFISQKVALSCPYIYLLPKKIKHIINHPNILTDIKDKLTHMDLFQDGSDKIVEIIVSALEKNNMERASLS